MIFLQFYMHFTSSLVQLKESHLTITDQSLVLLYMSLEAFVLFQIGPWPDLRNREGHRWLDSSAGVGRRRGESGAKG